MKGMDQIFLIVIGAIVVVLIVVLSIVIFGYANGMTTPLFDMIANYFKDIRGVSS